MAVLKSSNSSLDGLQGKPIFVSDDNDERTQVDIFTTSGTWIRPKWAKVVEVFLIGGGGGGASGRKHATGLGFITPGGGGGGPASAIVSYYYGPSLSDTVQITVGAGGLGGTSVSTNDTGGNDGTVGGDTIFGSYIEARGGGRGNGLPVTGNVGTTAAIYTLPYGTFTSFPFFNLPTAQSFQSPTNGIVLKLTISSTSGTLIMSSAANLYYAIAGSQGLGFTSGGSIAHFYSTTQTFGAYNSWFNNIPYISYFNNSNNFLTGANGGVSSLSTNGTDGESPSPSNYGSGGGGGANALNNIGNSGAGGVGANGVAIIKSYSRGDFQEFRQSGTWYKPNEQYEKVIVLAIGAGAGGASGARLTSTASQRYGGPGGGVGGISFNQFNFITMNTLQSVTVGLGGAGGAALTVATVMTNSYGMPGQIGGSSSFGSLIEAGGGRAINLSTNNAWHGLPINGFGHSGTITVAFGGASNLFLGARTFTNLTASSYYIGPGPQGSGASSVLASTPTTSWAGNNSSIIPIDNGGSGGSTGTPNGGNAIESSFTGFYFGGGGGAGLAGRTSDAGAGGNGSAPGGGGGGAGGGTVGFLNAPGGNGGDGRVWVICL